MIHAQLAHFASHMANNLAFFQDEGQTVGFSPWELWQHMAWMAKHRGHHPVH